MIVEGEKTEPAFFRRIFNVFELSIDYEFFLFCTEIYNFFNKIIKPYDKDLASLDILNALREAYPDNDLFQKKFTDILLVFDFDPQAIDFHSNLYEILSIMQQYFTESTENGKLYISYPAIEAYKHVRENEEDEVFFKRTVALADMIERKTSYKQIVNGCTSYMHINKIERDEFTKLLQLHANKAWKITHEETDRIPNSMEVAAFAERCGNEILKRQMSMIKEKGTLYVISMALFFISDYFGWQTVTRSI